MSFVWSTLRRIVVPCAFLLIATPAMALWFAVDNEYVRPVLPSTPPCVLDLHGNQSPLPARGEFAMLVVDYDGYLLSNSYSRSVYERYFAQHHQQLVATLRTFVVLSTQQTFPGIGQVRFTVAHDVRIPCGYLDDPDNQRKYAYMPGLYLYRNGVLEVRYLDFPDLGVFHPKVLALEFSSLKRFAEGASPTVRPLPLLWQGQLDPVPEDLLLPAMLVQFSGLEWAAPQGEEPLKRPMIERDAQGMPTLYKEFPSGHIGARGRYLIEKITPFLKKADIHPVGLIPPDGFFGEEAVNTLQEMRKAFPDWSFIQLDASKTIRFYEVGFGPFLVGANGRVTRFIFRPIKPASMKTKFHQVQELPAYIKRSP